MREKDNHTKSATSRTRHAPVRIAAPLRHLARPVESAVGRSGCLGPGPDDSRFDEVGATLFVRRDPGHGASGADAVAPEALPFGLPGDLHVLPIAGRVDRPAGRPDRDVTGDLRRTEPVRIAEHRRRNPRGAASNVRGAHVPGARPPGLFRHIESGIEIRRILNFANGAVFVRLRKSCCGRLRVTALNRERAKTHKRQHAGSGSRAQRRAVRFHHDIRHLQPPSRHPQLVGILLVRRPSRLRRTCRNRGSRVSIAGRRRCASCPAAP